MSVNIPTNIKAVIFDFDGTLVESNSIKFTAFEKCFVKFPVHFQAIMRYCREHHHIPRSDKFRYVFEEILQLPYPPEVEKQFLALFEDETTQNIIAAPEIEGATAFVKEISKKYWVAILSSTPHEILLSILEKRGLSPYIHAVQGAPVRKSDWLLKLQEEKKWSASEILFFGDTGSDCEAAKKSGVEFIGVGKESRLFCKNNIADFKELLK